MAVSPHRPALPPYVGRFAPSPTGPLHFGSLVAAVASRLDALANRGQWRVRIDDLDGPRVAKGAADRILVTLERFGFTWDGAVSVQTQRLEEYASAFRVLQKNDIVFPCNCSRRQIDDEARPGIDGALVYPGTCRHGLAGSQQAKSWRVRVGDATVEFTDRALGVCSQALATAVGDFIVRRADGIWAYQLAVVVDDTLDGVTDVVRGADLALSTPRQIFLQRALALSTPVYLHVPVVTSAPGVKLSKQSGAPALDANDALSLLERSAAFLGLGEIGAASRDRFWALAALRWGRRFAHPERGNSTAAGQENEARPATTREPGAIV